MGLNYTDLTGATQCKTCKSGSIPTQSGDKCDKCPAGTFSILPKYGIATCEACPFATTSKAGSAQCNNGGDFNWLTGYGYVSLTTLKNTQAHKNLNKTIADPARLINNTGIFLYSVVNGIFDKQIEALENLETAPKGAKEAWQAWGKVDWRGYTKSKPDRWPDNSTLLNAIETTGTLLVNVLSTSNALAGVNPGQINKVFQFTSKVNPAATITYLAGFLGDFISYASGERYSSIENEITNIQNGFAGNDFRQVGEAFGILIREVMEFE